MPSRASDTQTFAQVHMMLPNDLPVQDWTGGSWFHGIVLYCHCTYAHPATVFYQTVAAVHAIQNGAQMRMTFDEEVTHVICYRCECHLITVGDVHNSLHAAGYNTSLLVNSLTWPSSNSIPIVYSDWLKDCNSQGVLLNYIDYLI